MIPDHTDNPSLRKQAAPVALSEITSPKIKTVIEKMKKALAKERDGVAIAAPQIGVEMAIFVVAGYVFDPEWDTKNTDTASAYPDAVFINPRITKRSKRMKFLTEGCLSVRWLYGEVKRHTNVTIEAYDEHGTRIVRGAGGLLAQIFQHEIDHLEGVLFIDKAQNLEELPPQK